MARGFRDIWGIDASDHITRSTPTNLSTVSYHFKCYAESALGSIFSQGSGSGQEIALGDGLFAFFQHSDSGDGFWYISGLTLQSWVNVGISYDRSATANDPSVYFDGSLQSFSFDNNPAGNPIIPTQDRIGNNPFLNSALNGMLAEFAIWNALLTAEEFAELSKDRSPLHVRPTALVEYFPLVRDIISLKNASGLTINGTLARPHPRIIYPSRIVTPAKAAASTNTVASASGTGTATGISSADNIATATGTGAAFGISQVNLATAIGSATGEGHAEALGETPTRPIPVIPLVTTTPRVHVLSFIEIEVPFCTLTYSISPCTAALGDTGDIKCFNSLGTCQDRPNFTDEPVPFVFAEAVSVIPAEVVGALPLIKNIDFQPSIVSLDGQLGQRASLKVTFRDAPHSDAGPQYDKYPGDRNYTDPYQRGTFWGKFRARNPFLRGRAIRLIRGNNYQPYAEMERHHFVIDSIDGPNANGDFSIVAKDILKFAAGDRAVAPTLSNGFLTADLTIDATTFEISPAGIGSEYPVSGYLAIGGSEIVSFTRDEVASGNDINCTLLLHMDGVDESTTFHDESPRGHGNATISGGAQVDTAQSKFGGGALLLSNTGDGLTYLDHEDWTFGASATVDCWVRLTSFYDQQTIFSHSNVSDQSNQYQLRIFSTGAINFRVLKDGINIIHCTSAAGLFAIDTWYHIALVKNGNIFTIYVDGNSVATTTNSNEIPNFTGSFKIGFSVGAVEWLLGWIDEFRISNNARWTANFSPPVVAYAIPGGFQIVRGQLNTTAVAHKSGDRVQRILRYQGIDGADILNNLLQVWAGINADHVPINDWKAETAANLGTVYTFYLTEPTPVDQVIEELLLQMGAALWWDDVDQLIKLQVLRNVSTAAEQWNEDNVLEGTLDIREQPDKRVSQVIVYFGQINPLLKVDEPNNYRSTQIEIDRQSEIDEGSAAIKVIYARGIAQGGRSTATRVAQKHLSRYVRPPRRFNFELFRYAGQNPQLGQGVQLGGGTPMVESWPFQDETGARLTVPIQITRLDSQSDKYVVEAEEVLFTAFGADIDPTQRNIVLDAHELNVNLRTRHDELFATPLSGDVVNVVINSGVIIGSISHDTPAIDVGTWPVGVIVNLTVNGRIQGRGGNGASALTLTTAGSEGIDGAYGGVALYARSSINVINNSQIWGGGGGGGSAWMVLVSGSVVNAAAGGGGAGTNAGLGGATATLGGLSVNGNNGTSETGGPPVAAIVLGETDAQGGFGGNPGQAGGPGSTFDEGQVSAGGDPGAAIDGVSYITLTNNGNILGPQIN